MSKPLPDHLLMRRRNGTVSSRGMVPDRRTKAFREKLTRVQLEAGFLALLVDTYLEEVEAATRRHARRMLRLPGS